jgi:hypothetical protein
VIAKYKQTKARLALNFGINLGAHSDLRAGAYVGRTTASIEVGNPGLPELEGKDVGAQMVWRFDAQDSPVVPSGGLLSQVRLSHTFNGPDLAIEGQPSESSDSLTQLSAEANHFWTVAGPANRVFLAGSMGTSFEGQPVATAQFPLGSPFRLGAYDFGELRGAHYYAASGGYLRRVTRLPDFVGGPVFAGAWLENGDAFDAWSQATWRVNGGAGIIMDTLVGPVILAGSWGFNGRWRTYLAVGRIFR